MPAAYTPMQLLAPLLLSLVALGTGLLWLAWRQYRELLAMSLGFFCVSAGLTVQVIKWPQALFPFVMAFSVCYLLAMAGLAKSLAYRFRVALPCRAALWLSLVLLGLQAWFSAVTPSTEVRVYAFNVGAMLFMALPLWHWKSMQMQGRFNRALRWVYVACIALNLLRTFLLMPAAHGVDQAGITLTWYWMALHFCAMVSAPVLAASMVLAVAWDVIQNLQSERNLDALTQLLNRRGFEESVQKQRACQEERQWALLVCDLDYFKRINDTWGHAVGDQVLQTVSRVIQDQLRPNDLVARYGGEEFVVLLAGTNAQLACKVAERMCQCVASTSMPVLQGQSITLSIGVATLPNLEPTQLAQALQDADAQLYVAKRAGRNQVAVQTV